MGKNEFELGYWANIVMMKKGKGQNVTSYDKHVVALADCIAYGYVDGQFVITRNNWSFSFLRFQREKHPANSGQQFKSLWPIRVLKKATAFAVQNVAHNPSKSRVCIGVKSEKKWSITGLLHFGDILGPVFPSRGRSWLSLTSGVTHKSERSVLNPASLIAYPVLGLYLLVSTKNILRVRRGRGNLGNVLPT